MNLEKIKLIFSTFFLVIGLITGFLTYNLSNKDSFGNIDSYGGRETREPTSAAGGGVDSSNDGVAVGLGIISGFSFLSATLLLTSIQKNKEKE